MKTLYTLIVLFFSLCLSAQNYNEVPKQVDSLSEEVQIELAENGYTEHYNWLKYQLHQWENGYYVPYISYLNDEGDVTHSQESLFNGSPEFYGIRRYNKFNKYFPANISLSGWMEWKKVMLNKPVIVTVKMQESDMIGSVLMLPNEVSVKSPNETYTFTLSAGLHMIKFIKTIGDNELINTRLIYIPTGPEQVVGSFIYSDNVIITQENKDEN